MIHRLDTETDLGPLLRVIRHNQHLSLKDMADAADCDESQMSKWERGLVIPDLVTIMKVLRQSDAKVSVDDPRCLGVG